MKKLMVLFLALSAVTPAFAGDDDAQEWRTLSVAADAEVKAKPDKVDVQLSINEKAPTLAAAKKATDEQLKSLFQIAKEMGIAEKDMQTTYSSVQPEYRWIEHDNRQELDGYRVTHNVTVTLRKLDDLGAFTEAVLAAKIDEIQGVTYGIETIDTLKEAALQKAIEKAKRKADVMAAAAGVKVGRVLSMSEAGAVIQLPMPMPRMAKAGMAMGMAAEAAPTPPSGESAVRADVSVTFELQ